MVTWFLLFYLRYNQSLLSCNISLLFPFLIITHYLEMAIFIVCLTLKGFVSFSAFIL